MFEPIAIVGRGAVLPGAYGPDRLWEAVRCGRDLLSEVPDGLWPIPPGQVNRANEKAVCKEDRAPFRGGFIDDAAFGFDPSLYALDGERVETLDRATKWLLHAGRCALEETRGTAFQPERAAVIVGNLSYPTDAATELAYRATLGRADPAGIADLAQERFASGRPAALLARTLGVAGTAFCLDAACASSLYAIKFACDLLQERSVDIAFAGGLNGCYNLLLHSGFSELNALSPSGRSRPFHRQADGLVPSEGAAVVAIKRLPDALEDGDEIHAVIRGIGLSNDGRQRGILAPSREGQISALRRAYSTSGIDPKTIGYLECHATGTTTGDRTELETLREVFASHEDLPVGSLKSNIGHLITAAGMAGILKMIGTFRHNIRPVTLHADDPVDAFDGPPLRLLTANEPWPDGVPKRAGLNNFGFGGNNAHLILEEFDPATAGAMIARQNRPQPVRSGSREDRIVVCAIETLTGDANGTALREIGLPISGSAFPPSDLKNCLGQQTLALQVTQSVLKKVKAPDSDRIAIAFGMGLDMETARACLFWRAEGERLRGTFGAALTSEELKEAIVPLEKSHCVIGTMPNLVANRINVQLDIRGYGLSVSSEELSGNCALELGCRALRNREVDLFLAGAVDLSTEQLHRDICAALPELMYRKHLDGGVVFALKRLKDAIRDGDAILAEIDPGPARRTETIGDGRGTATFSVENGFAHCAAGALDLAMSIVLERETLEWQTDREDNTLAPFHAERRLQSIRSFTGWRQGCEFSVYPPADADLGAPPVPHLWYASAETREELIVNLKGQALQGTGPVRLAIVARTADELEKRKLVAARLLGRAEAPRAPGIYYGEVPAEGELALMFPGLASAYRDMTDGWKSDFSEILASIVSGLTRTEAEKFDDAILSIAADPKPDKAALATSAGTLFFARVALDVLNLAPDAALGVSLGEANMLAAFGIWERPQDIVLGNAEDGFYDQLGGDFPAIVKYLDLPPDEPLDWKDYDVFAPVDEVVRAAEGVRQAWITIIYSAGHCLLSGRGTACEQILSRLGKRPEVLSRPGSLAFHGPFAEACRPAFARRHTVPVRPPRNDVRFYFNAINDSAPVSTETCASLYIKQGFERVDFRQTIEKAWADGVRVFVETGPRTMLCNSVSQTLGDRPHICFGLDQSGRSALYSAVDVSARLFALGRDGNIAGIADRLKRASGGHRDETPQRLFSVPAHLPAMNLDLLSRISGAHSAGTRKTQEPGEALSRVKDDLATDQILHPAPALPAPVYFLADYRGAKKDDAVRVMRLPADAVRQPVRQSAGTAARLAETADAAPVISVTTKARDVLPKSPPTRSVSLSREASMSRISKSSVFSPSSRPFTAIERVAQSGLALDRKDLEKAASGRISEIFGALFKQQDGYERQCRMPRPPMLLADRVTGISGEPGSMGQGICWTETDVADEAWYLDGEHMPTGILIEAGQADLLLISWLGADFLNRSERVYRLLGCEIVFHDRPMPKIGDTIKYQIHIDSHANIGDTRMFFFRYDARIGEELLISVRNGQAGFFSDDQLANSDGVLWSPEDEEPAAGAKLDLPPVMTAKRSFGSEEVKAFADGDLLSCFGAGFEWAAAHQKTPKIPAGKLQMIEAVESFDPAGGPWGRGYLRASFEAPEDAWFYDGHFQNDPCMPGTLMAEAATQALQFYAAACGLTIDRDGYRFTPVRNEPFKFVCRGQVIPDASHHLTYEVFIEEIDNSGDQPVIYAALLAKSDGFKVFLCRRFGMTMVRDWPLPGREGGNAEGIEPSVISPSGNVRGDHQALLAAAWGRPSDAFGPVFAEADPKLDTVSNPPRLPGPPYHCMTRILKVDCHPAVETPGGFLLSEFDDDPDAWYFAESGTGQMPFSVLSEVLLQPCGWFASYMGYALGKEVKFRNLDGEDCICHMPVSRDTGTLTLETRFVKAATAGPMTLVFYEAVCKAGDRLVMTLKTDFGFFPKGALAQQKGLPAPAARKEALLREVRQPQDDAGNEELHSTSAPAMPAGKLDLIDSVTAYDPDGGAQGLGRLVGRQAIHPGAWYFKAHFFTDPVQPGSLGLEALFTLFKTLVRRKGLHATFTDPVFQAPACAESFSWHYRGQVVPANKEVVTEFEIAEIVTGEESLLVRGNGSLWVDGLRIYEVKNYALRICENGPARPENGIRFGTAHATAGDRIVLDLETSPWLAGHKPSYVIPVYPMLGVAGRLLELPASRAASKNVSRIENLEIRGWLALDAGPLVLDAAVQDVGDRQRITLHRVENGTRHKRISVMADITRAPFRPAPAPWTVPAGGELLENPYEAGELFHDGPFETAFDIWRDNAASTFEFDIRTCFERACGSKDILLDTLFHGFPHFAPHVWYGDETRGMIAFPYRLESLEFFGPVPQEGRGRVITRKIDMPTARQVRFGVQFIADGRVLAEGTMSEALVPADIFCDLPFAETRRFCLSGAPSKAFSLSHREGPVTVLSVARFRQASWLPGTYEKLYRIDPDLDDLEKVTQIAIKDHVRRSYDVHPGAIVFAGPLVRIANHAPIERAHLRIRTAIDEVRVSD